MARPVELTFEASEAAGPFLADLTAPFFPQLDLLGRFAPIASSELPPPYRSLLAHDDHMTVALEAHHDSLVDVTAVEERKGDDWYARTSVLSLQRDGARVQVGVMRIDLTGLPEVARRDIEGHKAPLGRILIRNSLLREVEVLGFWRVDPGPELTRYLEATSPIYGRSARILVDGHPAVALLEIVASQSS